MFNFRNEKYKVNEMENLMDRLSSRLEIVEKKMKGNIFLFIFM